MNGERDQGHGGTVSVVPLIDHLFRRSAGRLVASLVGVFGPARLDLAEEVVQEALLRALQVWPFQGVPADPEAWIYKVARNRALDITRREGRVVESATAKRLAELAPATSDGNVGVDDELLMIFMCCHPDLPPDARVALTLRTIGGLSTGEIAAAFLTNRSTIQQRIVRAKRTISERNLRLTMPRGPELAQRRESVLAVIYLMFNEGYAATDGDTLLREELCGEALRLARLIASHPDTLGPEVDALVALLALQASRLSARAADDGAIILLEHQDRSLWDRSLIAEGLGMLERSMASERLTRYHAEAGVASCHATASTWEKTDWERIVTYYDILSKIAPSHVVTLNRAIAVAMSGDVEEAMTSLEGIQPDDLGRPYLLGAALGHLLTLAGEKEGARSAFGRALMVCPSKPVRSYLQRRISELEKLPRNA